MKKHLFTIAWLVLGSALLMGASVTFKKGVNLHNIPVDDVTEAIGFEAISPGVWGTDTFTLLEFPLETGTPGFGYDSSAGRWTVNGEAIVPTREHFIFRVTETGIAAGNDTWALRAQSAGTLLSNTSTIWTTGYIIEAASTIIAINVMYDGDVVTADDSWSVCAARRAQASTATTATCVAGTTTAALATGTGDQSSFNTMSVAFAGDATLQVLITNITDGGTLDDSDFDGVVEVVMDTD